MKTVIAKTRTITMGLFILCVMGLVNTTTAGNGPSTPAKLTFVGKVQNRPVFQLDLNNGTPGIYFISIKDANNNILYSEKVKGANVSRNYQLDVDDAELNSADFGVKVEVTSAATHQTKVYRISSETKVTSNIVVAQL